MKRILKYIYRIIPFKRALFTLLKVFWRPSKSVFQHLHFQGAFTVLVEPGQSFTLYHPGNQIENEIFWRGLDQSWERDSIRIWKTLCAKANTILDIGANTGIYALVAKAVNPNIVAYAFEPHPMFFPMLQHNIRINQFNIQACPLAISDKTGLITIDDYAGEKPALQIEATTLDAFIIQHKITALDVIKIDVEKHEPQVLAGFAQHLPVFKPTLLIEILTTAVAQQVEKSVSGLGYLYFNINEKGSIRKTDHIEVSDHYNYLICQPAIAKVLGLI
jgi:FkbM family methyltransferase